MTKQVVWYGGSFSPPTRAHIKFAQTMGETVYKITKSEHIKVVFVPVSSKYNKPSIKEACISEEDRLNMLHMTTTFLNEQNDGKPIEYSISTHELEYGHIYNNGMPTYLSIPELARIENVDKSQMWFALGEDNIQSIAAGKWNPKDDPLQLLRDYNILCNPRGETTTNSRENAIKAMIMEKLYDNILQTAAKPVLDNMNKSMYILNAESDSISSTEVRSNLLKVSKSPNNESLLTGLTNKTLPDIAEYCITNRLYLTPACNTTLGGRRKTRKSIRQ